MKQHIAQFKSFRANRIDVKDVDLSDLASTWKYLSQASGIQCDTLPSLAGLSLGGVA